jgi:Carboxypeptidase regulatory-like domain
MRTVVCFFALLLWSAVAFAQVAGNAATLRVTVVDPSGAVIVGARVQVADVAADTGPRGDAVFAALEPGHYAIHVEAPGFEPAEVKDVRVRSGENRREVKLAIARLAETVQVGRDPRERASDPRGDAFATILDQQQIDELPDDPDEMEQALRDLAGPGAVVRVNGFRGGRLPPKSQIQQIRFRRNMFAADMHEPGFVSVDIITKPGLDSWRGSTSLGFRDSALNARNAFAPEKGDEQHERYGFALNGPLWKQRTSLSLSVDGTDAFDTKTIVAALPSGYFADSVRKPNDALNVTARLEHALSKSQIFRAELQHNGTMAENLGVGDFDLIERGYTQDRTESVLRASTAGAVGKALYNELRVQWLSEEVAYAPASSAPAVLVLNAFNAGGAQLAGSRGAGVFTLGDDLDIAAGRHAIRTGLLLDAGRYRTSELRNTTGTFTFASLADYTAARPTTFTRNVGDPSLTTTQAQLALYVQDDMRVRKDLTISGGVRQEIQTHIGGLQLAPRGGISWSPFKSGKTTVRAGGGVFFDWLDAQTYEQGVQLDGTHQRVETIMQPGYPDPTLGGTPVALPDGRVQFATNLDQPQIVEAIAGVEQTLPGTVRVNAMYMRRRGSNLLRGVNINAPLESGVRPDPLSGTITEIQSIGRSRLDALSVNVNYARPQQRLFVAANYTLGRSFDEADTEFSLPADNYDLAGELGPTLGYPTHRFMSMANLPLKGRFRLATSLRALSALPYNIITGHDDNDDTVSNDRPAGVARNSGRGGAQVDLGLRVSWSTGFGGPAAPPAGPQVRILRGDNADPLSGMPGGLDGQKRYTVELYVQAYNALNRMNPLNFSGVLTSPFFGQPTSAAAPRRVEIGTRFSF